MATVRQMSNALAARYVINLRLLGYPREEVVRRLMERFPGTDVRAARAMVDRGVNAEQGAALLEGRPEDERLLAREIRRPDPDCYRWRYYVIAHVDRTGEGDWDWVPHTITSTDSLTRQQLDTQTRADVSATFGTRRVGSPPRPAGTNATIGIVEVIGVERAC